MLEIAGYESERRIKGTLVLAVLLAVMSVLFVGLFPSIASSGVDFEAYLESLPPAMRAAFGATGAVAFTTIEGFLAIELYQFFWLLMLGIYAAYVGGGLIAGDVERDRMDVLLAAPVARRRVVVEKFLSLVPVVVALNLVVGAAVYATVLAVGESISVADLAAVHLLSIPYLLACGAVGLVLSVVFDASDVAKRGGLGAVFGLFLLETVSQSADVAWLGAVSPTRYYDPTAVLVRGEYDWLGAVILLAGAAALVAASAWWFRRKDIA
ncbi:MULTISPECIES: ABC transporter permease subunit [Halorussus]|uniref:ABC transporter permease subunit n=1 Tax=Halorussus TaxID=1070314 RepID=UPI000E20CC3B|nr:MULTISPECIES: ABC transporter permease subunit [Halorussus]NHN57744.1 ABC transporter permease subunit [Halorussus sp. JP-T4]